jgi:branched-chain amino acid transport system permease protein
VTLLLQQITTGFMLGSIYVTVAVAFTLTIGVLNFLNFTIPAIFMITGMIAWAAAAYGFPFGVDGGISWPLALFMGVTAAVFASLIVERFTLPPHSAWRCNRTRYSVGFFARFPDYF